MLHTFNLSGLSPIIMHNGAAGLDANSAIKREIAELVVGRGARSVAASQRIIQLECKNSLYLTSDGIATFPPEAIRASIESAAKKSKKGPLVREGLVMQSVDAFHYDVTRYGATADELSQTAQFTVPVVVQRARILRTRAKFDLPWSIDCTIDADDELIDTTMLLSWLTIAGRRIGLGDWRPEKSGVHGRFAPRAT